MIKNLLKNIFMNEENQVQEGVQEEGVISEEAMQEEENEEVVEATAECEGCHGTGLIDSLTLCSNCDGTGEVSTGVE